MDGTPLELPNNKMIARASAVDEWRRWPTRIVADIDYYSRNNKFKDRVGVGKTECSTISDQVCRDVATSTFGSMIDNMNAHDSFSTTFVFEDVTDKHKCHLSTVVRPDSIKAVISFPARNPAIGVFFNCSKADNCKKELIAKLWKSYVGL